MVSTEDELLVANSNVHLEHCNVHTIVMEEDEVVVIVIVVSVTG